MSQRPPLPPLPPLPQPFQAAVGLAAEAAEQVRRLPELAVELPVRVAGTLLQLSMRAQQRYSALAARGEAILTARPVTDEPPPWATFDDADVPGTHRDEDERANGEPTLPRPSRFDLISGTDDEDGQIGADDGPVGGL